MSDCVNGDIRDVLPEMINGTLPAADVARVREHVRACGDCAAEVELLRAARAAMRLTPTMDTARIAAAVQASTARRLSARGAPQARVVRVAGLSLVAMIAALAIWSPRDSSPPASDAPATSALTAPDKPGAIEQTRPVEARGARAPLQLALGGDMSELGDDELLALLSEVSALEAMPGEEPASLAIEPVVPVDQEEM